MSSMETEKITASGLVEIIKACADAGVDIIKVGEIEISFTPTFKPYQQVKLNTEAQTGFQTPLPQEASTEAPQPMTADDISMDELVIVDPSEWERRATTEGSN